jgi:hypothetical protein
LKVSRLDLDAAAAFSRQPLRGNSFLGFARNGIDHGKSFGGNAFDFGAV